MASREGKMNTRDLQNRFTYSSPLSLPNFNVVYSSGINGSSQQQEEYDRRCEFSTWHFQMPPGLLAPPVPRVTILHAVPFLCPFWCGWRLESCTWPELYFPYTFFFNVVGYFPTPPGISKVFSNSKQ